MIHTDKSENDKQKDRKIKLRAAT